MRNKIILYYPSSWWGAKWREALPAGNGEIGVSVYGGIYKETIMLTHSNLWWNSCTPNLPDVSYCLPKVRELLKKKEIEKADKIYTEELTKLNYRPVMASPLPLADFNIIMSSSKSFKNYKRELDMEKGEINVSWQAGDIKYKRSLFVSRSDNMVVLKITSNAKKPLKASINIDVHNESDIFIKNSRLENHFKCRTEKKYQDDFIYYAVKNDNNTDFGAVIKIIAKKIKERNEYIDISGNNEILILIKLFVNGDRSKEFTKLTHQLNNISDSYSCLLNKHVTLHKKLFDSTKLSLYGKNHHLSNEQLILNAYYDKASKTLIEKLWSFGRYLFVSSTKNNGEPCHLYGLWCGEYKGMWAFNMLNENIQMIYWHSLSGNMAELMLPVFDYYERLIPDFIENAKKLYGCRGIFIPAPTAPDSGLLKQNSAHIIHWTGGAGWLSQLYYDYYRYTKDKKFLKERALPFMKLAALFYEDFLQIDDDGYYISYPSNSPENIPSNYWSGDGMQSDMETTINATMDFAIIKELLNNLIEGYSILNESPIELEHWKEMLLHIPEYQVNDDGAIKEWMHEFFEDNYCHRHESHIYPVFPGIEITKYSNNLLFSSFVEAVKKRLEFGLKEQTGWSLAHMANSLARMGDGNKALNALEIMLKTCLLNNFFTTHNDWRDMGTSVDLPWAPIQIDANMGLCSAINEMLLFSDLNRIVILPALPDEWDKGYVENLLTRGAIEVSINWDKTIGEVKIKLLSLKEDTLIDLILPEWVKSSSTLIKLTLKKGIVKELIY